MQWKNYIPITLKPNPKSVEGFTIITRDSSIISSKAQHWPQGKRDCIRSQFELGDVLRNRVISRLGFRDQRLCKHCSRCCSWYIIKYITVKLLQVAYQFLSSPLNLQWRWLWSQLLDQPGNRISYNWHLYMNKIAKRQYDHLSISGYRRSAYCKCE